MRWAGSYWLLLLVIALLLVPAEDSEQAGSGNGPGSGETFTDENYGELFAEPGAYEGAAVEMTGQLLGPPETEGDGVAFQIWADPQNVEWNTVVYASSDAIPEGLSSDDYVRVQGVADGVFEGENAFGATIDAPIIEADSVEATSAGEANRSGAADRRGQRDRKRPGLRHNARTNRVW